MVEDDQAIRETLELVFTKPDYHLISYDNGEPILAGQFGLPDLFILDKQLSGVDGLDVCRHLKADATSADVPVIVMSASNSFINAATEAGADATLIKPFKLAELRRIVSRLI